MKSEWQVAGVISEFRGIWGPGIAAAGLIVTSGLLGVGDGMVFRRS